MSAKKSFKNTDLYVVLHCMRYGSDRRRAIMEILSSAQEPINISVNRKHCLLMKQDPDLQKLVKKGLLAQKRMGAYRSQYSVLALK